MSNNSTSKTTDREAGPTAKFAVVRLKPGDNLLGLFQLLIHNGFGEVSFVNNLSETIFPVVAGGKRPSSPAPALKTSNSSSSSVIPTVAHSAANRTDVAQSGVDKVQNTHVMPPPAAERYHFLLSQPSLQLRAISTDTRPAALVDGLFQNKANSSGTKAKEDIPNSAAAQRPAVDGKQPSQVTGHGAQLGSATLPVFATMPSGFLGLPTMPSLNAPAAAAAAAIAALSEAATPPYSLANFFLPNNLPTTITSAAIIPPPSTGNGHQYSPAILAAAAAAHQRPTGGVPASTVSSLSLCPRSPHALVNRAQLQPQQQQRVFTNHQAYQSPQQPVHQFQSSAVHQRSTVLFQQQQSKGLPQNSPAASPRSSSNSSSNSNHQGRPMEGILSTNCVPLPPGCATTHLRQRGQRSYAEDPSLYVACRLCKNKIMGSRISNLTNHVRRHSSMKQFQCCYCDYTHNEMAKVRLHMLHNHKDKDSQPIDNLSPEMQASWDLLMRECFPDHCQQQPHQPAAAGSPSRQQSGSMPVLSHHAPSQCSVPVSAPAASAPGISFQQMAYTASLSQLESTSNGSSETANLNGDKKCDIDLLGFVQNPDTERTNVSPGLSSSASSAAGAACSSSPEAISPPAVNVNQPQQIHQHTNLARCVECGMYVNAKAKGRHIRKCHLQCLLPFVCSMCGYDHSEHSKVKVHICLKHDDDPMAQVVTRDLSTYAEQLVPVYFPSDSGLQYSTNVRSLARGVMEATSRPTIDYGGMASQSECSAAQVPVDGCSQSQMKMESVIVYGGQKSITTVSARCYKRVGSASTCSLCSQTIPKARTIHHARRHLRASALVLICPVCDRYESCSRSRILRHLAKKHGSDGKSVKPLIFRRAPIALASDGGLVRRALRRCFPSSGKVTRTLKQGNAIIRRYRLEQAKNKARLPKSRKVFALKNHLQRLQHQQAGKRRLPLNGVHSKIAATAPKSVLIRTEPKLESRAALDNVNGQVQSDLFRMCPLCVHWIRTDQMAVHFQTHVPTIGSSCRCNQCDFMAPDPMTVRTHFLQEHQIMQLQQQPSQADSHQTAIVMT